MQTALYILLALLVAAAIGLQVWVARAGSTGTPANRLQVALRVANAVLLAGTVLLVIYVVSRR